MYKEMKIGFIPHKSTGNAYIDNMKSAFRLLGDVLKVDYKNPRIYKLNYFDVVVLSWRESYFIDGETGKIRIKGIIKEFTRILLLKFISKKLCLIKHNNFPHRTAASQVSNVKKIQRIYYHFIDILICHSGEPRTEKLKYVPHPKYFPVPTSQKTAYSKHFIIFGRIEPYKNIESLFPYIDDDFKLLICGSCNNTEYLLKLKSEAPKSVEFSTDYISDDIAQNLISNCQGLLLLGNSPNMIVSGSFHYGMSCSVMIFALSTPYLKWYKEFYNASNICVSPDIAGLLEKMKNQTDQVYDKLESDNYHKEHSIESVALYLQETFKGAYQ
jgi:beta-1,4-mannosyltransferase